MSKLKIGVIFIITQMILPGIQAHAQDVAEPNLALLKSKKDHLNLSLSNIEDSARSRRHLGGGMLIGFGALFGVGGALASSNSSDSTAFGISGGIMAAAGALVLAFPTDFETLPTQYSQLPEQTPEQITTKVTTGESYLSRLGNRAKRQRVLNGGVLITLGVAQFVWYAAANSSSNSFLLYEGAIFTGIGIANFFFETEPETEYRDYQDWSSKSLVSSVQWGVIPLRDGGALALNFKF